MVRFRPSTKPASASPLRSPLTMNSDPAAVASRRKPTTGIDGCCARAAIGHAAAPLSSVMNSRRFMSYLLASGKAVSIEIYHVLARLCLVPANTERRSP
jgi:hypothetical protein